MTNGKVTVNSYSKDKHEERNVNLSFVGGQTIANASQFVVINSFVYNFLNLVFTFGIVPLASKVQFCRAIGAFIFKISYSILTGFFCLQMPTTIGYGFPYECLGCPAAVCDLLNLPNFFQTSHLKKIREVQEAYFCRGSRRVIAEDRCLFCFVNSLVSVGTYCPSFICFVMPCSFILSARFRYRNQFCRNANGCHYNATK